MKRILAFAFAAFAMSFMAGQATAEPFNIGADNCGKCHKAELEVWENSPHAKSYKTIHKTKGAKELAAAVGGQKNMRKNDVCTQCHFTKTSKDGKKFKAKAGPSCESCHGPASEYIKIHNDFGGAKRETETAEHKAKRQQAAIDAGMTWSFMHYDVASNCMGCHGMSKLDGATIDAMMDGGHPINSGYEVVKYSQGAIRHRYYPPDMTVNREMTASELARLYVTGQAAALVDAKLALSKSQNARFAKAQNERIAAATKALEAIKGDVPEAAALLADGSEASARKLVDAIKDKDLSGVVGSMLPDPSSYK